MIPISGKDSFCTAMVQINRSPRLPYELFFNEVGWELPETLEWLDRVESYFGQKLIRLGDDLTEICYEQNCLPLSWRRFCTKYAKIKPLNDYLGVAPAKVYFGLRADEPERIGYVAPKKQPLEPVYPLRELGLGLIEVWEMVESVGMLPPQFHWPWMESRVRELLGRDQFLLDELRPWQKATLLAWRTRNNCAHCFYKRLYEWIGLHEFHPTLFEGACRIESDLCHKEEFGWLRPGQRIGDLLGRADAIKEKRARSIAKFLRTKLVRSLFEDDEPLRDELEVTSCGLLCGK